MKKKFLSAIILSVAILQAEAQNTFPTGTGTSVGIGTTTPSQRLEVVGNMKITSGDVLFGNGSLLRNDQSGCLELGGNDATTNFSIPYIDFHSQGLAQDYNVRLINQVDKALDMFGSLRIWGNNTPAGTNFLLVNGNTALVGNVGIGTSTPSTIAKLYVNGLTIIGDSPTAAEITGINAAINCTTSPGLKLWVNGTIGAKELRVNLTSWCDYVFNQQYSLRSLKEVERYILLNKHLPEVPSEKEVTENGVAVGEMMKIHMKKIEELTLYVIEQNKRIQELELLQLSK